MPDPSDSFQLPEIIQQTERSASPTMDELMETIRQKNATYWASKSPPCSPPLSTVSQPTSFTSREVAGPVAAIAVSPAHPDYMVIGTYELLKKDELSVRVGQIRTGSVSVLPLAAIFKAAYPGNTTPFLDKKCLNAAVLDIKFHPSDDSFFAVATSDAKITFFGLTKFASVHSRRVEMNLLRLGEVEIAECNQHGEVPLITTFTWLPGFTSVGKPGFDQHQLVSLAATVSDGEVKLVKAKVPSWRSKNDIRFPMGNLETIVLKSVSLDKHTEEAWTAATVVLSTAECSLGKVHKLLILSGGDDSALIATRATLNPSNDFEQAKTLEQAKADAYAFEFTSQDQSGQKEPPSMESLAISPIDIPLPLDSPSPLLMSPAQHLWTDRKTHGAGVTAVLPFTERPVPLTTQTILPILTGSYDEKIRLFVLDTSSPTLKRTLLLEKALEGGVWRLNLMDEFITEATSDAPGKYSALILVSNMHAGAKVLRITHSPQQSIEPEARAEDWKIQVLQKFNKGHDSMVYGADFRKKMDGDGKFMGEYEIVSTSFYDKKVCVWTFKE